MAKAYVKVTRTTTRRRVGEGSGRKTGKSTTGQKRCPNCGKFMKQGWWHEQRKCLDSKEIKANRFCRGF
jgi:hypothetical protein